MKKIFYLFLGSFHILSAVPDFDGKTIDVNNSILARVNKKAISVIDVKKNMDIFFHKAYPKLTNSIPARYQFYVTGWKDALNRMIEKELMLAEAERREIKVTDSEIREELIKQFGSNIMQTLDKIGISYEEAWESTKQDIIAQRMSWFFIHTKALKSITPELIRKNYRLHVEKNPPVDKWQYHVISIKTPDEKVGLEISDKVFEIAKKGMDDLDSLKDQLKDFEKGRENLTIKLSQCFDRSSKDISSSHKKVLQSLKKESLSNPIKQISKLTKKPIFRIFYLKDHEKENPPTFEQFSKKAKDELFQKAYSEEAKKYISKLKKSYSFEEEPSSDLQPFVIR